LVELKTELEKVTKEREASAHALQEEKQATSTKVTALEEQKRSLERELASARKSTPVPTPMLPRPPSSPAVETPPVKKDPETVSGGKKKKKKKKKTTATPGIATPTSSEMLETPVEPSETSPRQLLEDYISEVATFLSADGMGGVSPLTEGSDLWNESISRGVDPVLLSRLRFVLETVSKESEVSLTVQKLDEQVLSISSKAKTLATQVEQANSRADELREQLTTAENELQAAKTDKERLVDENRSLKETSEEIEELRDM
jgi:outer membrane murein-binding lipoprotein Lpp